MKTVGLRELKNRLSAYVRQVRAGRAIIITDRGQVVAELHPPGLVPSGAKVDPALARLVNRGLLGLGAPNSAQVYPHLTRLLHTITSTELLDAARGRR